MANQDVEAEIRKLMRPKSVASSYGLTTKSLLDWKIEQKFKDEEDRVGINFGVVVSIHTSSKSWLLTMIKCHIALLRRIYRICS